MDVLAEEFDELGSAAFCVVAGEAEEVAADDFAAEDCAGAASLAYQVSTPLWPLHAPCFLGAVVKVPSLHLPVVPAGAPAGT